MEPYAVTSNDITKNDLDILRWVRERIRLLPNGRTCHEVCESLAMQSSIMAIEPHLSSLTLVHVRGYFARKGWDHSWLLIPNRPILIDPYPWCCGSGPILVYTGGILNPWRDLYIPEPIEGKT